ncbi:Aml1p [Sugiyamaella lignohabitans]|uniref:Aml1p n=1 Tax=Sugiyamaella lignohabitans TaxID=796027 RepID=A0A167FBU5_9ASCO|nr:Aml1p [Sugiyamaella lignohabitans]ANB15085.1 Aml1p [Sugiyamaella lignohabitans]
MDSDDELQLSASTLAALQEFQREEKARKEEFEKLSAKAEEDFDNVNAGIDAFQEDWNLSQFWYDDKTANLLADELLDGANESTRIIIVSAPSVYGALSKRAKETWPTKEIYLLEYDDRFKVLAKDKFHHYDFARPLDLPKELAGSFDRILIDPPFLSEDCQTKGKLKYRFGHWLLEVRKVTRFRISSSSQLLYLQYG